jgi:hypothetical protein
MDPSMIPGMISTGCASCLLYSMAVTALTTRVYLRRKRKGGGRREEGGGGKRKGGGG